MTAIAIAMTAIPPTTPPTIALVPFLCPPETLAASAGTVAEFRAADVEVEAVVECEDRLAEAKVEEGAAEEVDADCAVDDENDVVGLDEDSLDRNGAASSGFELRNPAVRSPAGQPPEQGFAPVLQHPINGGVVYLHVYQLLPSGHCSSGNFP